MAASPEPLFWKRWRDAIAAFLRPSGAPDDTPSNRGLVLAVCFSIAVVLWLATTLQETKTITLELPTRVVNIPAGEALVRRPPARVEVRLRGEGLQLLALSVTPPTVTLSAARPTTDVRERLLLTQRSDVTVESVRPRTIEIPTAPRIQRRLAIVPRVTFRLPAAYELIAPPKLSPDSVQVSGAAPVVRSFSAWPTQQVTVRDVRDSTTVRLPLADTLSYLVTRSIDAVQMHVRAGRFAEATRTLPVRVTGVPTNRDLVALDPSTIRVRYRVLFEQLFASQRTDDFYATVSYNQIRSDTTGRVAPRLHIPSDLMIRNATPIPSTLRYYTLVPNN